MRAFKGKKEIHYRGFNLYVNLRYGGRIVHIMGV